MKPSQYYSSELYESFGPMHHEPMDNSNEFVLQFQGGLDGAIWVINHFPVKGITLVGGDSWLDLHGNLLQVLTVLNF